MKPRYLLLYSTPWYHVFRQVNDTTGLLRTGYLMPRWRWAEMCKGIYS